MKIFVPGPIYVRNEVLQEMANPMTFSHRSKEFTKLLNQINLYGNDLVSSLRDLSFNTASPKFSELLNGLSTTISSGGDLSEFFEKRAESLLLDYKLEREKYTKSVETIMNIYIGIVITAPFLMMMILLMLNMTNFGIGISTNVLGFLTIGVVILINIIDRRFMVLS